MASKSTLVGRRPQLSNLMSITTPTTVEHRRLADRGTDPVPAWDKWGPFVSERSWGTVREDYSPDGYAWGYFPHDLARSKAYRWGEDGIAGLCDRYQLLVFALAFWNGRDPILKERMFGLSNPEGNHGEDVKEYWFFLDSTPSYSYMRMLYKYPQRAYPYEQLIRENARRRNQFEYELLDTGIFDDDRYFDIFIEYAKASPEDICMRIEAVNRGPEPSELHILPQLWFRNTWVWTNPPGTQPQIGTSRNGDTLVLAAEDPRPVALPNLQFSYALGPRYLAAPANGTPLFTDNETNWSRVPGHGHQRQSRFVKDAFHRYVVNGEPCVNPQQIGTKACITYNNVVGSGDSWVLNFRLLDQQPGADALDEVEPVIVQRKREADEFYEAIYPPRAAEEERSIERQALAGMLWSRQIYLFDVNKWLDGDDQAAALSPSRKLLRNVHWRHLNSMRLITVPDRWEFPWFAAWDLAFQCVTLALADPAIAKENLWLLLFEQFQHPNGQIPAYEWEFSDLNPPVHAWACWRVFNIERQRTGREDLDFLEKCFHKLLINFAWWVNRVDQQGNNVFEGGFLGLDNITVVDRSHGLPGGARLEQSDGTGWMGFFCLNLMRIALELAKHNPSYEVLATKFFEHFVYIGSAMKHMGGRDYQLWDDEDGFFYDVLRYPDGNFHKFRVRSVVGIIPIYAIEVLYRAELKQHKTFLADIEWFIRNRTDITGQACYTMGEGDEQRYVLSIVDPQQFARVMQRLADPDEFLSPVGLRSLSKWHDAHPYKFGDIVLRYEPAESASDVKGGNSNWRGPVWFATSYLLIEALQHFSQALGSDFGVACPGTNTFVTPRQLAESFANRLIGIFKRDDRGFRPCYGGTLKFQQDPHWRDHLLFNEYYHGDNGAGLGASHQTGWTGLVANLIDEWRR